MNIQIVSNYLEFVQSPLNFKLRGFEKKKNKQKEKNRKKKYTTRENFVRKTSLISNV